MLRLISNYLRGKDGYYATGKNTKRTNDVLPGGYYLEYNSSINQYRLNHASGELPVQLMGYNPHRKALKQLLKKHVARG